MIKINKIAAILGLFATSAAFGQPVTDFYDFDNPAEIADWNLAAGTAVVSGGDLVMGSGYNGNTFIELPIDFDRSAGDIKITAEITIPDIGNSHFIDFNIFAFYDAVDPTMPYGPSINGYNFTYYPSNNDNYPPPPFFPFSPFNADIFAYTGAAVTSVTGFALILPGNPVTVSAELNSDSSLISLPANLYMENGDHQTGKIGLRSWGQVIVHSLSVSYTIPVVDTDGDGYPDGEDAFPTDPTEWADADGDGVGDNADVNDASDLSDTVSVGGVDSGVTNVVLSDGNTLADIINAASATCGASPKNHGAYVSCVGKVLNTLLKAGVISDAEKDALQSAAAKTNIGKKK